nr:hypothetical protein [Rhodoferax sp.]
MSAGKILREVLRKVAISAAIVMGLLLVAAALLTWNYVREHRDSQREGDDPVREALAGPEPAALRGIARAINQFSTLDEAAAVALRASYHCEAALLRLRAGDMEGKLGRHYLECGRSEGPPGPGDTVLVVGIELPRQRPVSLELRKLAGKRWFGGGLDPGGTVASANGIEFKEPTRFVDLVLDAYDGGISGACFSPSSCDYARAERAKNGPPRWNGQPKNMGPREQIVLRLEQLGLQCSPLQSEGGGTPTGDDMRIVRRCGTRSFSGEAQTIDLVFDSMTGAVTSLDFAVAGKTLRVPTPGDVPEQPAGGVRLLLPAATGEVLDFPLAPNFHYNGIDRLKRFDQLSDVSRQRVVGINLKQVTDMLAAPDALPVAQLQKLDAAAALLARFGEAGLAPVRASLAEAPLPVASAMALAHCALREQAPDCLALATVARPQIAAHLQSAHQEAQEWTQGLAEQNVGKRRLQLLRVQLQAAKGGALPQRSRQG